jgi:L-seryl-tRNA(Ser) seleniumtransferase
MHDKGSRRTFLKTSAVAGTACHALAAPGTSAESNIYSRLGLRPVINGVGVVTHLGGSIMDPEVLQAMDEASRHFIDLIELQRKAGARLAELLGVPAAMVTGGAASAITFATAACVAQGDKEKLRRNERTAMMFFYNENEPLGKIDRHEWISVGKDRGVPTFNDAAADTPPLERLSQYIREGFDLVGFSGGKAIRGPQCSGMLLGRKALIEAAIPAGSPYASIGRNMKVGKEEMVGLLVAVERYLKADHEAVQRELESRVAEMRKKLDTISGLSTERLFPPIANCVPHLLVSWDESASRLSAGDVIRQLRDGEPSIAVSGYGPRKLKISVWMMRPGEHRIVAKRLTEIFASA